MLTTDTADNEVLKLDNVEFRRNRRVIITDVNLIIHAGERWVLFGPNVSLLPPMHPIRWQDRNVPENPLSGHE